MVRESNGASRGLVGPGKTASTAIGAVLMAACVLLAGASHRQRAERRQLVEQMTPQEKAELARKQERFAALVPEKREELRRLHERLEAEPDGEKLREVMRRYCDWLDTLADSASYSLRSLPVDERMKEIAKRRYGPQDARALRAWWNAYLRERHAAERRAAESTARDSTAERRTRFPDPQRVLRMRDPERAVLELVRQWELDKADFAPLRAQLSKATGEQFDRKTPEQQQQWVVEQFLEMGRQEMRRRVRGSPPVQPTDEQLAEFYHSDDVSDEDREWLMRMPGKEMHATLTRWYQMENSLGRSREREGRDPSGSREPFPWLLPPGDGRRGAVSPPGMNRRSLEPSERDRRSRDGRRRGDENAPSP
ncbi:MAG: hypothetical protein GX621_11365 [Pirellulaceae bacterium]|nr:hypothetical protein [Pirellulaceae bacterium]